MQLEFLLKDLMNDCGTSNHDLTLIRIFFEHFGLRSTGLAAHKHTVCCGLRLASPEQSEVKKIIIKIKKVKLAPEFKCVMPLLVVL